VVIVAWLVAWVLWGTGQVLRGVGRIGDGSVWCGRRVANRVRPWVENLNNKLNSEISLTKEG